LAALIFHNSGNARSEDKTTSILSLILSIRRTFAVIHTCAPTPVSLILSDPTLMRVAEKDWHSSAETPRLFHRH